MIMIPITIVFLICVFFEKSDYQRSKECLPPFTKKEAEHYYNQTYNQTNVGNDGFEFDNSSTIPPPKTNNLNQ